MSAMDDHETDSDVWLARTTRAATVVIFRKNPDGGAAKILMVERNATLKFAGGATVFPGGKIDQQDIALAQSLVAGADVGIEDLAARIAAVRETLEETGLVIGVAGNVDGKIASEARRMLTSTGDLGPVLDAFGWSLQLDDLVPFARWWPKHRSERIFDTRFYLSDLGTGAVDIAVDATENRHMFWASAKEALALAERGGIRVIFPTRRNLERLALFETFEEVRAHARETPVDVISPFVAERNGERWLMIPDGLGYPVLGEALERAQRA
ncbi:NUDIX domain-containing protein [Novosphingobium sp. B1]|nr:NUDIX domain-containing protein [Novosphingobium sp. B1]